MTIAESENEIKEEFAFFENDWEAKYEHLIELGKSLPLIDPAGKTDLKLIKGCQSRVWLDSKMIDGKVYYSADSDAIITKGMIAVIIRILSGHSPDEILNADLSVFDQIGLKEHLSPTRANGLVSMIRQMKLEAHVLGRKAE
jgi:cysteine desulfuration protein SufE